MANFNIGSLNDWTQIAAGEVIQFPVPESGFRLVDFDVIADGMVAVHAVSEERANLVAYSDGMFNVRFSCDLESGVGFHASDDVNIFIRTKMASQQVAESDEPSFTSIEPRPSGPSDEIKRMMLIMQMNARQREQQLRDEIHAMRLERIAQAAEVIDAGDTPAQAETPAPDAAPQVSGDK